MKLRHRFMALVFVLVLGLIMHVGPALAVGETGLKNCGAQWVKVQSQTYGSVRHERAAYPSGSWQTYAQWNDATWAYHHSHTGLQYAYWAVFTDGGIIYTTTYAYCTSIG